MRCCFCNKPIKESEEFNLLVGEYSHKSCDDNYFEQQDKRVIYTKRDEMI